MPPCTTKRQTTTNLKTKNKQNCQKIKLYGSPTTKEVRKKHSFRQVGEAETGSWVERMQGKAAAEGWVPHFHADKPGGTTGEEDRLCNAGFL